MHKSALNLIQDQLKKHALGKLEFLSFIGTRPWGIARENVDYDYRGIYSSKQENTYQAFINQIYINNCAKDIILISLERFVGDILNSSIQSLIWLNSPVIYASKDFLEFKKWVNSHLSRGIYRSCRSRRKCHDRKDYLYDFFFMGNGISVLEKKKIIANLPELNKKVLQTPAINKIIEEEKKEIRFKSKKLCEKILLKLKKRLEKAREKSGLPEKINKEKLTKLKIVKKIDYKYWLEEGYGPRYMKEMKKMGI